MIRPWSFVKSGSCLFQLYDDGIDSDGLFVSNLEYDLNSENKAYGRLRESNGAKYLRFGLGISIKSLITSVYTKYLVKSPRLSREVIAVKEKDISEIIDLTEKTKEIVAGTLKVAPEVYTDFSLLLDFLSESGIDISLLGVEGSLLAGLTNSESDLDLILYGENNYKKFLDLFHQNKKWPKDVELFLDSEFGKRTIYDARKHYSPLSQKEMVFHESRRPTGFIKRSGGMRKFSIVGLLDKDDIMRKEAVKTFSLDKTFRFIGVGTVRGIISSDQFAPFRPSFYSTNQCVTVSDTIVPQEKIKNIKYIVDYLGNFYLHCQTNEKFECRASIEEIIINNKSTGEYRLNLNHWDDHLKNGFYLKTIIDQ
jgi:predicted nucleotidyltransferase